ncbi:3-deoxy-D-manno-octulosonic-acid transferase, putative [gamma proteobacterium HTCC5015]|nr:3-deoxy-D-manno-octulosonic-acid transferase, putative [gamma proteobacterium HTCC5015]
MQFIWLTLYQVAITLLAPLGIWTTLRDAKRRSGGLRFVQQRFGFGYPIVNADVDLWIHAASLGEVNAAKPLIKLLRKAQPEARILVTTATPAGAQAANSLSELQVQHAYLPIDWPLSVWRFMNHFSPKRFIVVETEIWPNLYRLAAKRGCRPVIVNGRLSVKTLRLKQLYPLFSLCLSYCEMIYTRSDRDLRNFIAIGADREQLLTVGNLKFSGELPDPTQLPRLVDQPYVLAASTHHDEERMCAQQLSRSGQLVVIIPRHPERRDEILQELKRLPLSIAVRSEGDEVTDSTQVYLADTHGEMTAFMAHANLVFMGGSLVPHGGQNLLEAARLGRPIICGPHTWNFVDEVAALRGVEGVSEVASADELSQAAQHFLDQPKAAQATGNNALELMRNNRGIARQYAKLLSR